MFSGPVFGFSGSPNQARKPPEALGSLKSSLEVFKMLPEAWPGLAMPCLGLAWPCPALAWPWPGLALAWPDLAWPALALALA